jgi:transcription elongation factor GreA
MIQSTNPRNSGLPLTADAYRRLELELEQLRDQRRELAEGLRGTREFGEPGGNDELMAIREEALILESRIARLQGILARAHVVEEDSVRGSTVAIGSQVTLLDQESGRTESYLIDGAHGSMDSNVITAVSPMGIALIGNERGAVVHVELPRGRVRTYTILDVAQHAYV